MVSKYFRMLKYEYGFSMGFRFPSVQASRLTIHSHTLTLTHTLDTAELWGKSLILSPSTEASLNQ